MQRMPSRNMPPRSMEQAADESSPMLKLARRIREEQGPEQVKAFLAAMTPFSAPNEIKKIGEGFGISPESIEAERAKKEARSEVKKPDQFNSANAAANQLNQLRMLMQLSGMIKNGGDPMAILNLLGGR